MSASANAPANPEPDIAALLATALRDTDFRRARAAVQQMVNPAVHRPEILAGLSAGLLDADASVRRRAAQALGGLGTDAAPAVSALIAALGDASWTVREAVVQALAAVPMEAKDARSPETTDGRDGFIHPHRFTCTTAEVELRFIARDFDAAKLEEHEQLLRKLADDIAADEPRARVTVTVEEQYRNMKEFLDEDPAVTEAAEEAARRLGVEPWREPIRGGTDGAMLSARGLLTPNIYTGVQQFHSVLEWASVQDMALSAATIVELAKLWAEPDWASRASGTRARSGASPR